MKNFASKFSLVVALLAGNCHAGSAPETMSTINGYFLGFSDGAYVSVHNSKAYLQELKSHCSKRGRLWALGHPEELKCGGLKHIPEGGNGPVFEVVIEGLKKSGSKWDAILFSTKPFSEKRWARREATQAEANEVTRFLNGPDARLSLGAAEMISRFLFNRRPTVIEGGGETTFLVPWVETEDGTGSVNSEFIVLARHNITFQYTGNFAGKASDFVDITGDGVPEMKVDRDCDGICFHVVSLYSPREPLLSISVH